MIYIYIMENLEEKKRYCYICKLYEDPDNLELDDFQDCESCDFSLCNVCYIRHQDEFLPHHPCEIECFICLKKRNDECILKIKSQIFELLLNTNRDNKINSITINKIKNLVNKI